MKLRTIYYILAIVFLNVVIGIFIAEQLGYPLFHNKMYFIILAIPATMLVLSIRDEVDESNDQRA